MIKKIFLLIGLTTFINSSCMHPREARENCNFFDRLVQYCCPRRRPAPENRPVTNIRLPAMIIVAEQRHNPYLTFQRRPCLVPSFCTNSKF